MCGIEEFIVEIILLIKTVIEKILVPIIVAAITYFLFKMHDECIKRRQYSTLGVAIMESLLEEVINGINIMRNQQLNPLPVKSWDGVKTISDDILLRIIAVSKDVQPIDFPPREIRIHCKNYFEHMSDNWASAIINVSQNRQRQLQSFIDVSLYVQAAEGVKAMLIQCKELLENNSRKTLPK